MTEYVAEFHAVDRTRFEDEIVPRGRPAILRGLVADWPLVRAARAGAQSFADWLNAHATAEAAPVWFGPPSIDGRFGFTDDLAGYNHDRKMANVAQLLDLLLRQRGSADAWSIYAGALPVDRHLRGFRAANPMPLLDPSREMLVSLWLGNRTSTAAHWDLPQNLACVVAGRRRFTLFPIEQVGNLYVGPLDRTIAGQPSSLVDVDAPDLARFPRFVEAQRAALVAELEPGDVLYLPSLWWHAVRSEDDVGGLVNFWWRDGPAAEQVSPLLSLLHALMTTGGMPADERARWRVLFDHYVFRDDGDPAAHIPASYRGMLESPSAEVLANLRRRLAAENGR
ncbi:MULTISPECIES: cupin-like domain-containing protein [unclassified Sphingomonas]|uniref:cupin-like domain-containing protein n=1 Tax=unclassified Sphingomonas TaxID=196159 RepID=UPI00226AEA36|nr:MULTISPECIES: cupin-like domain-containing protein [unclassified Sphingomonas]